MPVYPDLKILPRISISRHRKYRTGAIPHDSSREALFLKTWNSRVFRIPYFFLLILEPRSFFRKFSPSPDILCGKYTRSLCSNPISPFSPALNRRYRFFPISALILSRGFRILTRAVKYFKNKPVWLTTAAVKFSFN